MGPICRSLDVVGGRAVLVVVVVVNVLVVVVVAVVEVANTSRGPVGGQSGDGPCTSTAAD